MRVVVIAFLLLVAQVAAVAALKHAVRKVSSTGNHTTSSDNRTKTYTLKDLKQGKPLMVVLKQRGTEQAITTALPSPINVTISDDHGQESKCTFTRMNSVCYLKEVKSVSATKATIECAKAPCEEVIDPVQADISEVKQQSQPLGIIYNVNQNSTIVELSCNDSNVEHFVNEIKVYANTPYDVINRGPLIYLTFQGELKELLLLPSEKIKKCANILFAQNLEKVEYGKVLRAFLTKETYYTIPQLPKKELRADVTASEVFEKTLKPFNFTFYGTKEGGDRQKIDSFTIHDVEEPEATLDFNIIVKGEKFSGYKKLQFSLNSTQQLLVLLQFNDADKHEMDAEEESFFSLKKGQSLSYTILGGKDASKDDIVSITTPAGSNVDLNQSENPCQHSVGCNVTVTAKEDTSTVLVTGLSKVKLHEVSYLDLKSNITLTLNQGETKYLLHNTTSSQNKMIRISSPNVIVYVGGEKCPKPSAECHQFSGNFMKIVNVENQTGPLYVSVEGLELVRVTIWVEQGNNMIELKDGVPLPVNMQKDKEVYLRFRLDKKRAVNFNLIASVSSFSMYVANSEELPDSEDVDLATSTSYLKINEDEVDKLVFTILVKRLIQRENERFTIIASTDKATIMLDQAEPHYDLLEADETKRYVTLVNPNDLDKKIETILSISIFQKLEETINLTVTLSGPNNSTPSEVTLSRRDTAMSLFNESNKICDQQDDESSCEVYITIQNNNKQKVDLTMTVLMNNSIIELKPGVWQRYEMTSVTSSNHFYFYPNNKKFPVAIQFSHTYAVYKLAFLLWNNELKEVNPGNWPYPEPKDQPVSAGAHTTEYTIHPEEIAKCYPNCIVLISLWNAHEVHETNPNVVTPLFTNFGSYSIMATDSIIEMLQQHKMTVSLVANESKYFLVSVTPYLQTNKTLTFMCSDVLGYHSIVATVSSNKNLTMPTEQSFDWRLQVFETQITMENLKNKLKEKGMDTHEEIDIILVAKGMLPNKFIFEYTSRDEFIQALTLGNPQQVEIPSGQTKFFSVDYFLGYRVKLIRRSGFPALTYKPCQRNQIPDCLEAINKAKPNQITSKADEFRSENCNFCVLIIKLEATHDRVEADLIALSDVASVQLRQGQIHTDFGVAKETNEYKISVVKGSDTIVTVTVFEGEPTVTAQNVYEGINITGKRSGNTIRLLVPSSLFEKKKIPLSPFLTQNYALSGIFSELTIRVIDDKLNCSYSISYTVGERHIELTDGVLVSEMLHANDSVSYSYHNQQNSTAIASITFNDTEQLQGCEIIIKSYKTSGEEPQTTKPQKMQIHKKTPKPSLTFSLNESFSDYELILKNKHGKEISLNLTINHVDIVLLPFGYEYPSSLASNESAYFIVEIFNDGYVQFTVKKCADSDLTFAYAMDDESFEKEDYAFTTDIEQTRFTSFVHVKASTMYVKIRSEQGMLYSIKAAWYGAKKDIPKDAVKPGNKGFIDYQITGVQEATVTFTPIICNTSATSSSHCPKAEYYYLMSNNREQVVSQTECPGSFFLFTSIKPLKPEHIKPQKRSIANTNQFKLKMPKELTYLGIKALLEDGRQVTYNVIEVATIWGSLQKNKHYHLTFIAIAVLCCCFCMCMRMRRLSRDLKGKYSGVQSVEGV